MNILFIYQQVSDKTGGGVFTQVIRQSLKELDFSYSEYTFPSYRSHISKLFNQIMLYSAGMSLKYEKEILSLLAVNNFDVIIFNGSQMGNVVKRIKRKYPQIKLVTIFHNLEYKFVLDAIRANKNPASLLTLLVTYINECNATKFSDTIVSLNERDSDAIFKLYKKRADFILPLCVRDRFDESRLIYNRGAKIGAFVGSNFYANNKGIKWFCENVSDSLNCKILIIGKGFEDEAEFFSHFPNITLVGTVDSIDEYYYMVDFIVSPIFDGSGMKTKTAEALMFGKTIFATPEAFEGYQVDYDQVGALCCTAVEFIQSINSLDNRKSYYNEYCREVFENNYSQAVFKKKLEQAILCE